MSYLAFLARWYNLVFLGLAAAGLLWTPLARRRDWPAAGLRGGLLAASFVGLTWNGALHDLGLGSPGSRFPLVLPLSVGAGFLLARGLRALGHRLLPPIRGVVVNRPGLTGARARVVSPFVGPEPGSGRAQWQDPDGVLHLVRCHTAGGSLAFGARVVLGEFDASADSYAISGTGEPRAK
ncbi:MAG: hypothetical protein ACE5HF_06470 [Gemmatimonadota bacterium]